jgi:hypothetical protein
MKKIYLISCLFLLLISCKKTSVTDSNNNGGNETPQLFEYNVLPSATNPAITAYNSEHFISVDTRLTLRNKLFVFLPGTTGSPNFYKLIVKKAASLGYHAIGLMYPNSSDLYTASTASSDLLEFGRCRQEIFDGTNQTSGVFVDSNNCIKSRMYKLLQYLSVQHPNQNWQQFISNGEIVWTNCVIAGHSQGGGHAFYMSKKVAVDRAISFSSIDWNSNLNQSAEWVTSTGLTPTSKLYSFNGTNDEIFNYTNVQTQLTDMNLIGAPINIDASIMPYQNSHRLITSASPGFNFIVPNHNLTVLDQYVPKSTNGEVLSSFSNAWTYLLN